MNINNLIREYICLVDELDKLKKEYIATEDKIKELSSKIEFYEKLMSILKDNLDIDKEYKEDLEITLKELGVLLGIDVIAILSGVLNNNPEIATMMMAFTGIAPVASANILKNKTDKKAKSQIYLSNLNYLNDLDNSYKKDKWELEQLEVEKDNLFDCYLAQLKLAASKRKEIASIIFQERVSTLKRIKK